MKKYIDIADASELDLHSPYSVRVEEGAFKINDKEVQFDDRNNSVRVRDTIFPGSPGLYRLIFLSNPENFTATDLAKYAELLDSVNALYTNLKDGKQRLKFVKDSPKYEAVRDFVQDKKRGGDLNFFKTTKRNASMTVGDGRIEYVHWDDPNELVERLRLLFASRRAGNTSHDNEITSIISELREEGIII